MIQIYLSYVRCNVETNEVGADEPYILVTAVNLESGGLVPSFEVVRYGPFQDVDNGEKHFAPGISRSFWNIDNTPATISDPNNVIFAVALMENDDGSPESLRGIVKGLVGVSLLASATFDHNAKVNKLLEDINSGLSTPTGAPNFDDKVGSPQQLIFTSAELNQAEAGQTVRKTLFFAGDGGSYTLGFEARNPVPFSGDLLWHKHIGWESGNTDWANNGEGIKIGNSWQNFKSVFASSEGEIFAIQTNGDLLRFKHNDWQNGNPNWANNGNGVKIKSGFQNFKFVFATSNNVIYAVQNNGDLMWFKHNPHIGIGSWANGGNGIKIGNSWQNFKSVFATSEGVIYAIESNGDLKWFKHNGWQTGNSNWASGVGKKVGNGWQNFKSVFSTSSGVIYAVQPNGDLLWYRHNGWKTGSTNWANGSAAKVKSGFQNFKSAFATSRAYFPPGELSSFGPESVVYGIQA